MKTMAVLSLRLQRFELVAVAILILAVGIAALVVRMHLNDTGATRACFVDWFETAGRPTAACTSGAVARFIAIDNGEAQPVVQAFGIVPYLAGIFLGVGLLGRELEAGTAGVAWALAGSRRYWLVSRVIPIAAVLVVLLTFASVTSDALLLAREPWVPAGLSFKDAGSHGPSLIVEGVAGYAIALLAGAILGRALPAVIISATVVALVWLGGSVSRYYWLDAESRHHVGTQGPDPIRLPGASGFRSMSRSPDGELVSDEEAFASAPAGTDPMEWVQTHFEGVWLFVPGTEYPRWLMIELAGFGLIAVVGFGLTSAVVERRRPL